VLVPKPRVLVVDDDEAIRGLIALILGLEGFDVTQAADGQQCIDLIPKLDPAVVVLDVSMPGLDGLAIVARLKAAVGTAHVGVVIVSARAQRADIRKGLYAGADVYLTKPFEPEVLIKAVRELAGLAHDGPLNEQGVTLRQR
jgi:DNA-binding response OmpR family regulator